MADEDGLKRLVVYIDTNYETHLRTTCVANATVDSLQGVVERFHPLLYPERGAVSCVRLLCPASRGVLYAIVPGDKLADLPASGNQELQLEAYLTPKGHESEAPRHGPDPNAASRRIGCGTGVSPPVPPAQAPAVAQKRSRIGLHDNAPAKSSRTTHRSQGRSRPKQASASSTSPEARQPDLSDSPNSRRERPTAAIASPLGAVPQSQAPATSVAKASAKRQGSASADGDAARQLPEPAVPAGSLAGKRDLPREPRTCPASAAAAPDVGGERQAGSSLKSADQRKKRRKTVDAAVETWPGSGQMDPAVEARSGGGQPAAAAPRAAEDDQQLQAEPQADRLGGTSFSQRNRGQLADASTLQRVEEPVPEDGPPGHSQQQGSQLSKRDKRLGTAQQNVKSVDRQAAAHQNGQARPGKLLHPLFRRRAVQEQETAQENEDNAEPGQATAAPADPSPSQRQPSSTPGKGKKRPSSQLPAASRDKRHKPNKGPEADVEQVQNQTNSGAEEAPDAQELPSLAAGASRQHPQKKRPTTGSAAAASGPAEKAAQSIQPAAEHDAETRQSGKRQATVSEAIARPAASQQPSRRKTVAGGGPAATAVGVSGRSQPPQTSDAKQRAASKSKLAADSASQNELQQTAVEATSKPGASPLKSKGVAPDAAQPDQQESSAAGSDSQSHTSESEEDGSSSEHNSSSEEGGSHELQANGATDAAQAIEVASAGRAATAAGQARAAQQEEMPETLEVVPETQVPDTQLPEEESSSDDDSTSASAEDSPGLAEIKSSPRKTRSKAAGTAKAAGAQEQKQPQQTSAGGKADGSSDSESSLDSVSESDSDKEGGPDPEAPPSAQPAAADKGKARKGPKIRASALEDSRRPEEEISAEDSSSSSESESKESSSASEETGSDTSSADSQEQPVADTKNVAGLKMQTSSAAKRDNGKHQAKQEASRPVRSTRANARQKAAEADEEADAEEEVDAEEEEEEEQPSEQAAEDEASEGAEGEPPSGQPEESTPAADESEDQPRRKTFEGPNALQMLLRHTSAQKAKERGIVLSQPQQPEADCPNSEAPASDAAGQKSHPTQQREPVGDDWAASGLCPEVVDILRKPVSAYPKSKQGTKELIKAVKEALRLQMAFEGRKVQRMFKEEKPVWWPLDTWDSKVLDRGKAVCEATLHAMRNHFKVAASNA